MQRFFLVRTVRLFKVLGIQIEIDYSWFIIVALVFFSLGFQFFPLVYGFSTSLSLALGALTTLLFFTSVLLHELSHSVVANRNGVRIKKIILFIFGGVASLTQEPTKPGVEFRIAIAGPLMSLLLSALFFAVGYFLPDTLFPLAVALQYLSVINLALALFNLIPGYPLDGGRLLRALLWHKLNLERATIIASRVGVVVGYLIIAYGVFQFLYLGSVLGLIWFAFIGFFLISAARESVLQVLLMSTLGKITVRELMSHDIVSVRASMPLREVVERYILGEKQSGLLVTQNNLVVGEISIDLLRRFPVRKLSTSTAQDIMVPIKRKHFLRPSAPAAKVLQLMAAEGFERLPVYINNRLTGVVTRDDIRVYLSVKTDLLNQEQRMHAKV
jgi:Zn-dependent protease/predicted transcriptional regulator